MPDFKNLKGLKILFSAEDFWPRLGGGEAFIDEFLTELAKKNEVHCVYIGEKSESKLILHPMPRRYAYKNLPVFNRTLIRHYYANKRWKKILRDKIKEIKPDLIITQLIYTPASIDVAKEFNLPVVVFIHNYEHFSPNLFKDVDPLKIKPGDLSYLPFAYKIQWPFYKWLLRWHENALKKADLILPDTKFIVNVAKKFYNVDSYEFFPVVDLGKYVIPKEIQKKYKKEYITMVNPIKYKGIDVFLKIAEKMSDENFLVVCGANATREEGLKNLPNITYLKKCPDIKKAYAQTKILLVPSTWPEPFGRVVMEAGMNGIPSIVSPLGGLPEAVGNGGLVVDNLYDADEWVAKIRKMKEKKLYAVYSRNAKKYSEKHSLKNQINIFKKLLNKLIF